MDGQSILGNNHIKDVRWLCSLSESELDFLMGLKTLIHQRAKKIGHETLVNKFDLRTLRVLSFILMENLKGQLKDLSATSSFECNLLNHELSDSFSSMKIEDLIPYICSDRRKRTADMFFKMHLPIKSRKLMMEDSRNFSAEPAVSLSFYFLPRDPSSSIIVFDVSLPKMFSFPN